MRVLALLFAVVVVTLAPLGCKPELLPGTDLEDTPANRQVLDFLGKYRAAIVKRSADDVIALCAPDYFEDGGTAGEAKDDYGMERLRKRLKNDLEKTKEIQLDLMVQKIEIDEKTHLVKVAYKFNQRALLTLPSGDKWVTLSDVNRLVLRDDDGDQKHFHVVSGL